MSHDKVFLTVVDNFYLYDRKLGQIHRYNLADAHLVKALSFRGCNDHKLSRSSSDFKDHKT